MQTSYKRQFVKDLRKLQEPFRSRVSDIAFNDAVQAKDLSELQNVVALQGYTGFCRIRVGDYRIGLELRENALVFYRVMHRKDIYRNFP